MEHNKEYHDPDYPEASTSSKEASSISSDCDKIDKIKTIICREFDNEIALREEEIIDIDQKSLTSRRLLHRLRYALVTKYFNDQKLVLTPAQIQDEIAAQHEPRIRTEVTSLLRDGQRNIHPSVKKLLGKDAVNIEDIFKHRAPRNTARKDYVAMLKNKNYTIRADDTTTTLRPESMTVDSKILPEDPGTSRPKKIPRHIEPKNEKVVTLEQVTRNKQKHRYRIIIGNTSIYSPSSSSADKSTHKWLVYVRSARDSNPDALSTVLSGVTFTLHHSYAPHHIVNVDKPPFHLSRRGWGEFTAQITLHFAMSDRNRPATVEHNVKLDRNYTGFQTLGAETIVDVWLYSNQEMLQYEHKDEDDNTETIKQEPQTDIHTDTEVNEQIEPPVVKQESWLDFFDQNLELDVDEMLIKPPKETAISNVYDEFITIKEEIVDYPDTEIDFDTTIAKNVIENQQKIASETQENEKSPESVTDIPPEILNQPNSPKKRIVKYIDPKSGKIYYLEIDKNLDLGKIQEIVININGNTKVLSPTKSVNGIKKKSKSKGVSLLKPEVKNQLKTESKDLKLKFLNLVHIVNDHCYLGTAWSQNLSKTIDKNVPPQEIITKTTDSIKKDINIYNNLCKNVKRTECYKSAVNYLLKHIPLISERAKDQDYVRYFPFVVENESLYWKYDFAKRRNIEWSRAKLINRILTEHTSLIPRWRTKQILLYARLHGHYPIRKDDLHTQMATDENHKDQIPESKIKQLYKAEEICSLTKMEGSFESSVTDDVDLTVSDDDIDVVSCPTDVKVKKELPTSSPSPNTSLLQVENEDDRSRFLYLERICSDIGIELKNEDIGSGYSYSAVHAVLLSSMKCFAEELVRRSLSHKLIEAARQRGENPVSVWTSTDDSIPQTVNLEHVWSALKNTKDRHNLLTNQRLGTEKHDAYAI